jgi:hypothetical protein
MLAELDQTGETQISLKGTQAKKPASAPERRLRQRSQSLQRDDTGARPRRLQNPLAANTVRRTSATRSLRWQPARRSRKSPLHARAARANHVGAALSRHKRAGRIEERDGKLYAISQLLRDEVRAILAHRKGCPAA